MCILFVYNNPSPVTGKYRLILATNRDEHFIRNAQPAKKWSEDPVIISGIDLEPGREGGTWLGLSSGLLKNEPIIRIGALLNVTGEPHRSGAAGRGSIVSDYLKDVHLPTEDYISKLKNNHEIYNSFNFVAIEINKCNHKTYHYSNVSNETIEYENESALGFGNSLPDKPLAKVTEGQKLFHEIVQKYAQISETERLITELIQLLKCEQRHLPDRELQKRAPQTYEYLSSVFVHIPNIYGTRTHTIILVDWEGNVHYEEHTMDCPINAQEPKWVQNQIKAHL